MKSIQTPAAEMQPATSPTPVVWQLSKHIPQLDGVRGMAILIVTLYRFSKEFPTDHWLGKLLHTGFCLGDRGVDLFFVLSGFLITGILVDGKGSPHYFSHFFFRRALRIFPLYFVALLMFVIFCSWIPAYSSMFTLAQENQFYLWSYLSNVKMSIEAAWCFGYLDHFWSLAVEEHFYFVWPLVLFCISQKTALRVALSVAGLSAFARVGYALASENGVAPDVLTLFRCDALLAGAAIALIARTSSGLQRLRCWLPILFPPVLAIGLGCAILDRRLFTVPHTVWAVIWGCVLVWLLTARQTDGLARFFALSFLRNLGKYSYAMYVFQSPLIPIASAVFTTASLAHYLGNTLAANLLYMAIMFGLTYSAALISWHALEKHCLSCKKFFSNQGEKRSLRTSTAGASYHVG